MHLTALFKYCIRLRVALFFIANAYVLHAQTTSISGVINVYSEVYAIDTTGCRDKVMVISPNGFSVGDSVLLIQMKGANFDSTNTASFGTVNNLKGAGSYEIARITSIAGGGVFTLNGNLVNTYYVSGYVQLVRIPTYVNANVTAPLLCQPWGGFDGGVIVLSVQNNLALNANINADGRGFRGGFTSMNPDGGCGTGSSGYFYDVNQGGFSWNTGGAQKGEGIGTLSTTKLAGKGPLVNGGGGGNKHNTGGGGGSNYTAGGKGGNELAGCSVAGNGGIGGIDLSSDYLNDKFFLGGGGGRGDDNNGVGPVGENGGGIIIIIAGSITGNNFTVNANGNSVIPAGGASADGAGGGGGGGVIFIKTNTVNGPLNLQANGGNGGNQNATYGCVGPGGGGGTGAILTSLNSILGIVPSLIPGTAGVFSNGVCANSSYGALPGVPNVTGILTGRNLVYTPSGSISVSAPSTSFCAGQNIFINVTSTPGNTYSWTGPNSFSSSSSSLNIPNAGANMAGVYFLKETTATGCSDSTSATVSLIDQPVASLSSNQPVCEGSTLNFFLSGGSTYTLTGPNNFQSNVSNPFINSVSLIAEGIYTLVTGVSSCSSAALTSSVTIKPAPVVLTTNTSPVCEPALVNLTSNPGALGYQWSGPAGFSDNQQNTEIPISTPANAGAYTLTFTGQNNCSASAITIVTINPLPLVSISNADVCLGQTATLNGGGGGSYDWSGPAGFTATGQNAYIPAVTSASSGVYTLTVISANSCSATAMASLSVNPLPVPFLTVTARACLNTLISLQASGGNSYLWNGPLNFTSSAQNTEFRATDIFYNGVYTLTVFDAIGCAASETRTIIIDPLPSGDLNGIKAQCIPFCSNYKLRSTGKSQIDSIAWFVNNISLEGTGFNYCFNKPGNYAFTAWLIDSMGCRNINFFSVQAYPLPVADFETYPLKPIENFDAVSFTSTNRNQDLQTWDWYIKDNPLYQINQKDFSYLFENAGIYPVALVVTNSKGCSDTIVKTVVVEEDDDLYVPNTFTPNGDGTNDIFQPKGRGIRNYELMIYDRWGEKIHDSKNFEEGWDGRFKGADCKTDTYAWRILLTTHKGEKKEITGYVNLYK